MSRRAATRIRKRSELCTGGGSAYPGTSGASRTGFRDRAARTRGAGTHRTAGLDGGHDNRRRRLLGGAARSGPASTN